MCNKATHENNFMKSIIIYTLNYKQERNHNPAESGRVMW